MSTLYEISSELLAFAEAMAEAGGEIPAELEDQLTAWLEDTTQARNEKFDAYAGLWKTISARAEVRKAEAQRLVALAKVDANTAERLKTRLGSFFKLHNLETVQTDKFRLSYVNDGGALPVILSEKYANNPELLPDALKKIKVEPDMKAIAEEIKKLEEGQESEFGKFGERGKSLRIK